MASREELVRGYAMALLSVAEAEGVLDQVGDELFRFGRTVEAEPRLREALTDPALPVERKKALIQELLGQRAAPQTVNLLSFVLEQGRSRDLPRIVGTLAELAAERRQRAVAEVVSAIPLDEDRRDRLGQALANATGKRIELKVLVDPSVIGGVVSRVGDLVFDGTVRRRLDLARERLSQVR